MTGSVLVLWFIANILLYDEHSNSNRDCKLRFADNSGKSSEWLQYPAQCLAQNWWWRLLDEQGAVATDVAYGLNFSPARYVWVIEDISVDKPYYFRISHCCCLSFSRRILTKSAEFFHDLWPKSKQAPLTLIIPAECLIFPSVDGTDFNWEINIHPWRDVRKLNILIKDLTDQLVEKSNKIVTLKEFVSTYLILFLSTVTILKWMLE